MPLLPGDSDDICRSGAQPSKSSLTFNRGWGPRYAITSGPSYVDIPLIPLDHTLPSNDPASLDIGRLRLWIDACDAYHTDCHPSSESRFPHLDSLIMIDLKEKYLVSLPGSARYIALSYVWGRVHKLETTTSNFKHLSQAGSLSTDRTDIHLSKTIRDAMHLLVSWLTIPLGGLSLHCP